MELFLKRETRSEHFVLVLIKHLKEKTIFKSRLSGLIVLARTEPQGRRASRKGCLAHLPPVNYKGLRIPLEGMIKESMPID